MVPPKSFMGVLIPEEIRGEWNSPIGNAWRQGVDNAYATAYAKLLEQRGK